MQRIGKNAGLNTSLGLLIMYLTLNAAQDSGTIFLLCRLVLPVLHLGRMKESS